MSGALSVLVVGGDVAELRAFARSLVDAGFVVSTAESLGAATALAASRQQHALLVDVTDGTQPDALARVVDASAGAGVVLIASTRHLGHAVTLAGRGAFDVLHKPVAHELLHLAIRRAARVCELSRELSAQAVVPAPPRLVAIGRAMRALLAEVPRVAASSLPVVILGEPGTGKRTLAALVHQRGPRRARPITWLHGADAARAGLPSVADLAGGTLVVDAVTELAPELRDPLTSLGRSPDTRVICLATAALRELASRDAGWRALFHGLAAHLLEPPPLRRRREDLPVLAQETLAREASAQRRTPCRLGPEAHRALLRHTWPGNLPELDAVLARAVATARGGVLSARDLELSEHEVTPPSDDPAAAALPGSLLDLGYADAKAQALELFHRFYAGGLVDRAEGNINEAARRAGLDPANFRRTLRRFPRSVRRR